jgi:hypothetical protein
MDACLGRQKKVLLNEPVCLRCLSEHFTGSWPDLRMPKLLLLTGSLEIYKNPSMKLFHARS